MSERWDAIVVGAGPAGSTLSIRLAQAGLRVLLIDRAQFPRDKLCGEFLSPECWPGLDALGVARAIRGSGGQPIRKLRLWFSHRLGVEAPLPVLEAGSAVGLSRARLDDILIRRAVELGVSVAQRTWVAALLRCGDRIVGVRTRAAEPGAAAGSSEDLLAKVVIAADGRHSAVVRDSGRTRERRRPTADEVCAVKRHFHVADERDPGDAIELYSFPGGYAGLCRVEAGKVNLCTLLPMALLRQVRGKIDRALRLAFEGTRLTGWLKQAEPIGPWKTIPTVHLQEARADAAGVLYVGDARGTVDPVGGEGMAMAIEAGFLAGRFVERAVSRFDGCDRRVQRAYDSAWNSRFAWRIRLCHQFARLLARPHVAQGFLKVVPSGVMSRGILPLAFRASRGPVSPAASSRGAPA